jgi:hypothetical protein
MVGNGLCAWRRDEIREKPVVIPLILKPCPFGCDNALDISIMPDQDPPNGEGNAWYVECGCCLCRGPWASMRMTATELWNKRSTP